MNSIDTASWLTAGAIIALLVLSGFFSGSETALTASSRSKLRALADKGSAGAETALKITEDSERLIGSVLLGNNLVNILSASLATALFTKIFGDSGVALATLVMTLMVLIFAEVLPKTYAITNPETAASLVSGPIKVIVLLFSPMVTAVRWIVRAILALVGVRTDPDSAVLSYHEEIAGTLALGHSEGTVDKEDRDRLLGALDLSSRTVEEVMLHRSQLETVNIDASPAEIIAQSVNSPHSRLPAWRDEPENIVGVIHVRDLMREVHRVVSEAGGDFSAVAQIDIASVARAPYFVPDTTPLDEQMRQFLQQRRHFGLVIDEYGALLGLITLEDILEEIVGEIVDEHDLPTEDPITRLESGAIEIDGGMTIRDLNRAMDWSLPDDEANTVAGLVMHEAQLIPEAGQVFQFHGFRFTVAERQENRLTKLRIRAM
ncbi:HlyC/CorC family transporter [Pararhodobacter zhoushanensis]|uniref:HlyC/CorC family transporter n=1 Tax=Pararhodobacter zhoushanensis TaxID=2479545 RepID=A0ABT3GX98_9RHOB|nr:HlyC/CorC family transporter [Pararhodobacter zhoushanensis]MCW1404215.1 HlyC/CorC family transporter [Novosphingobium sp. MW5]MCW1932183.1 HlyC/CorC family transporter [Pararhodobacter zhoushanensis]